MTKSRDRDMTQARPTGASSVVRKRNILFPGAHQGRVSVSRLSQRYCVGMSSIARLLLFRLPWPHHSHLRPFRPFMYRISSLVDRVDHLRLVCPDSLLMINMVMNLTSN